MATRPRLRGLTVLDFIGLTGLAVWWPDCAGPTVLARLCWPDRAGLTLLA